ncbi:RF-1 domain containing protein [Rhypophila decipiens]
MALPRAIGFACRCNNTGAVATRLTARRISPLTSRDPRLLLVPAAAPFTTNHCLRASRKQMPSRPKPPPDSEIEESFLKGSGPGGQKINKTNSAVQLKHIPTGIVVKCQETRSRDQNRKIARNLLAQRLDILHNGDQSRWAIVGDHKKKKADSAAKKSRRKYKKLAEEKEKETAAAAAPAQQQDNDKGQVEAKPDINIKNKGEPFNQQSEPPSREPEMSTKS